MFADHSEPVTRKSRAKEYADWHELEGEFNNNHPNFFLRLAKKCQKLTAQELRVCALTRMFMSCGEIAGTLHISIRTVETHRMNIRRKFKLTHDEKLEAFLAKF